MSGYGQCKMGEMEELEMEVVNCFSEPMILEVPHTLDQKIFDFGEPGLMYHVEHSYPKNTNVQRFGDFHIINGMEIKRTCLQVRKEFKLKQRVYI